MHIVLLSPSDRSYISKFLPDINIDKLPMGYTGAIFIGSLIMELLNKGHSVTAITTTPAVKNDYSIKSFTNGAFTWIVIPSRPHAIRMNGNKLGRIVDFFSQETRDMVEIIKKIKPDIIHAHWSYEFAKAALVSGYPNLITIHDNAIKVLQFNKNLYRFGRLIMSEMNLRKVHYSSTVSPYMLSYVKKRCKAVKVIPNPVPIKLDEKSINSLISDRLLSIASPKIIMINNGWDERKNVKMGIIAFDQFRLKFPDAELHLFGDGYEIGGLANSQIDLLGIKNINFHGKVNNNRLFQELNSCHLLLHTALEESFGVVLIEAMSLGIPVIGGEFSGAVPWVINNKSLLIDVSDPNKIENKMEEMLTDKDLYSNFSFLGYQNVKSRFSSLAVANDYINYYNKILKDRI